MGLVKTKVNSHLEHRVVSVNKLFGANSPLVISQLRSNMMYAHTHAHITYIYIYTNTRPK